MVVFEMARPGQAPVEALQPGGISLLAAAARAGVDIDHYCGGQCSCGTCRIEIIEGSANLSEQDGMEQMVLGSANVAAGNRLACQARILGPVRVRVPQWF
jgi:ferredoxin